MSTTFVTSFIAIVLAWPLLLALPMIHSRLPWPRHLAIMPAAVLLVFPVEVSLDIPWLLFGTGFAIDTDVRWVLAMSVLIWLTYATVIESAWRTATYNRATTFFMLSLAGNLGAVLTTDLVGFFCFSTLMGYGIYALLIASGDKAVRRGTHLYLVFLIVADLALFEALLLAASNTNDLHYAIVRQSMADADATLLYVWIVLAGFALKAGVWPFHVWLPALFKLSLRPSRFVLGAVPITMGLLGTVRWLPIGEQTFYTLGTVSQILGIVGILYAMLKILVRPSMRLLPAWIALATSGLFVAALGTGLAHPTTWLVYNYLTYPLIVAVGSLITLLSLTVSRMSDTEQHPGVVDQRIDTLILWSKRWIESNQQWSNKRLLDVQSLYQAAWYKLVTRYQRITTWQETRGLKPGWSIAITMFVLVGLTLAWLAG